MNKELKYKLALRRRIQQTINSFRATKEDMLEVLDSGLDFEEEE